MEFTNERFQKQIQFILEIDKLKTIFRQNYLVDGSRKENDAEHSFHLALMVMVLSEYAKETLDCFRAIKMVLIHDLVEIYAGDTYAYDQAGYADKEKREKDAAEKLFSLLPSDQKKEFYALWREFEEMETPEAEFCAVVDRLQPLMLNLSSQGKSWMEHGVKEEDVRKRMAVCLEQTGEISRLTESIIQDGVEKGWLQCNSHKA